MRPILIIGGSGTSGSAFARICEDRNLKAVAPKRKKLDIIDLEQINCAIKQYRPWAIINASSYVNVDAAEGNVEDCLMANSIGPINLAKACAEQTIQFINFSSDFIFDGNKQRPYLEDDKPRPLHIYGHSKAEAEKHILNCNPKALIIRMSPFFGPWDKIQLCNSCARGVKKRQNFSAINDVFVTPTNVPHLVHASLGLLIDKESGIWHLTNPTEVS